MEILKLSFFCFLVVFTSCSKDSSNDTELNRDDLVGEYCGSSSLYYSNYYIEKISKDTFFISSFELNVKFFIDNNSLVIPRQKDSIIVEGGVDGDIYEIVFYYGKGEIDNKTGLLELNITQEKNDSYYTYTVELTKLSEMYFTGTFLSDNNDIIVELSKDPESDSIIAKVNMDYLNYQDSLLIEIKGASYGCSYKIDYQITDTTRIQGSFFYKGNDILIMISECLICEKCDDCNGSEETLHYYVHCCDEFFYFEGKRVD